MACGFAHGPNSPFRSDVDGEEISKAWVYLLGRSVVEVGRVLFRRGHHVLLEVGRIHPRETKGERSKEALSSFPTSYNEANYIVISKFTDDLFRIVQPGNQLVKNDTDDSLGMLHFSPIIESDDMNRKPRIHAGQWSSSDVEDQ